MVIAGVGGISLEKSFFSSTEIFGGLEDDKEDMGVKGR
jgi:hypothetical protein